MFSSTVKRSVTVAGALALTGAIALTTANAASAAPLPRQASAQVAQVTVLGLKLKTPPVTAEHTSGPAVSKSTQSQALLAKQTLVDTGVATARAVAGNLRSLGCSGLLGEGGALSVGGDGRDCAASTPGAGGVVVDLKSVLSALPIGVGTIRLSASSITANALYEGTETSGIARINNLQLQVCLGVELGGQCVGQLVKSPMVLRGTPNEDVVAAIVASITKDPRVSTLLAPLTSALSTLVSIRTNVQSHADGGIEVVGMQVKALAGAVTANLAVASAGPYTP